MNKRKHRKEKQDDKLTQKEIYNYGDLIYSALSSDPDIWRSGRQSGDEAIQEKK